MRGKLFLKIFLGVAVVLIGLNFFLTGVTVNPDGSSKYPSFSFPLSPVSSTTPLEPSSAPDSSQYQSPEESKSQFPEDSEIQFPDESKIEFPDESNIQPPQESKTSSSWSDFWPIGNRPTFDEPLPQPPASSPTPAPEEGKTHDVVAQHASHGNETMLPCAEFEGAEDVVLIIKTGATEVEEKMPVHFNTTLRCFPHYLVFSDFGEEFEGHTIHDAIGDVIEEIRLEESDFQLWRRLKGQGRATLDPSELSTNDHVDPNGGGGNPNNGGWRLDKFKNIPMVGKTLDLKPNAKWYIYTDADTYIVWSNLLKWTRQMDSTKLKYLGSPAVIDGQVFGHGGSGYILSNALMHKAADTYKNNQTYWDKYAASHWAGDCVLATMLEQLGAPLTWAYPVIQGGDPVVMDFSETGYDRRLWCYPAVSYHHIKPSTVGSLWEFEQDWTANHSRQMNHSDVFTQWLVPQLQNQTSDWDNLSADVIELAGINDAFGCQEICQGNSTCLQYSFHNGTCKTCDKAKLGKTSPGIQSGWMLDKIRERIIEQNKCTEGEWVGVK